MSGTQAFINKRPGGAWNWTGSSPVCRDL